jgi:hypothetical protein
MNDRIGYGELSDTYQNNLIETISERIKDDEELMAEIKKDLEEELKEEGEKEYKKALKRFSFENRLNWKIEEIATEALVRVRIYVDFDVEVEL